MSTAISPVDMELGDEMARFKDDPLGFVVFAYPWGQEGPLKEFQGPDKWQREFLAQIGEETARNGFNGHVPVRPLRRAVSSGHGTGKSTIAAWLVDWIMSTRPYCRGTVTANTFTQLQTKTWAAIKHWTRLCITGHWFTVADHRMYHTHAKDSWFVAPQSCREENSEAFAGQHAADSTSFYVFDEDSAISEEIHRVAEGGLTDGEPMIFRFGNCTRSVGGFYQCVFGRDKDRWNPMVLDSRESAFTNKDQIREWLEVYGEDSDFFRVRVRGLPPRASDAQFIDHERVIQAQKRQVGVLPDEPLVVGVDLAWGGGDDNVIRFRRGLDARSIPPIRVKGEFTRDPGVMVTRLADVLNSDHNGHRVAQMFLDAAGIAGPVGARLRELGFRNVQEINFGSDAPDAKCRYYRDYMWQQMKEWLMKGAIDDSPDLETDLIGPGTRPDPRQRVWLESKEDMRKRGLDSPDDADALALTFAAPVRVTRRQAGPSFKGQRYAWA